MNKFKFSISRPEERHVSFKAIIEREMVTLWLNNVYFGKIEENGVVELNPNILMKMPDESINGEIATHKFCIAPGFAKEEW